MSPANHSLVSFRNLFISRIHSWHFWSPFRHQFHCSPLLRFGPWDHFTAAIYQGVALVPVSLYSRLIPHLRSSPSFLTFTSSFSFLCSCSSYFSCFTARNVHYNELLNLQLSRASASCLHPGSPYYKQSTGLFRLTIFLLYLIYLSSDSWRRRCCGKTVWTHREVACHCCMYPRIGCMTHLLHPCGRCQESVVAESGHNGCTPFW